jgi:hypothetical protein
MKRVLFISAAFIIFSLKISAQSKYVPDDPVLYNEIVKMDSIYFTAYNNCDMKVQSKIFADSIEFYHDRSGLNKSKTEILQAIKNNICGKVTRELVKGSVEVYPLQGYGAVEMGLHRFHNLVENSVSDPSKFVTIWRYKGGKWQMTRVISLH